MGIGGALPTGRPQGNKVRSLGVILLDDFLATPLFLYTNLTLVLFQRMYDHDVTSIQTSSFVVDKPVKFIVHGYLDSGEKRWIKVIFPGVFTPFVSANIQGIYIGTCMKRTKDLCKFSQVCIDLFRAEG